MLGFEYLDGRGGLNIGSSIRAQGDSVLVVGVGEKESQPIKSQPITALSGNNGNVRIFFRVPNVRRFHFGNSNFLPHFQSLWTYIVKLQFIY